MRKSNCIHIFMLLFILHSFGQTTIPDNTTISGNWTLENSPYIIEGRAIVLNGETLTIEEGVEIRFNSSSASASPSWFDYNAGNVGVLRVQGTITANASASNPILFTRNGSSGYWGSVLIDENANNNSSFENCIIEYAKETRNVPGINSVVSFNGAISLFQTGITIESNEFRNNYINGLLVRDVTTSFEIPNNTFFDNGTNGLVIFDSTLNAINNIFYNNSIISSGAVSAIRSSNSNVYLVGNLIYNNDNFGVYTTSAGNHYIINNTIVGNSQGIRVESGANTYIFNSIIQNNNLNFATSNPVGAIIEMQNSITDDATFPDNVNDLVGNILGSNALFSDLNSDDFSLQNTSPCIDSGIPDTSGLNIPDLDIVGNPRIDNNIIDMGAFEFQQPLSVNEVNLQQSLSIYPNPASNKLNIILDDFDFARIYTLNGRLISTHKSKTIDLTEFEKGIYLLKIVTENGNTIAQKIIKN
ncbi:T9SS type A sorting domain-containing protein [Psychroflexus planctonicus]|nr:T9SS type A sorting domain-containing protein [Psychroflexus planctonicus]